MGIGIELNVVHRDAHLVEVYVTAFNGAFGGSANVYVGLDKSDEIAKSLEGFPSSISDTREIIMGATGAGFAGGGVTMRFSCLDGAGHLSVETRMVSAYTSSGPIQSIVMLARTEPAAIDSFVTQLRRLGREEITVARLATMTDGTSLSRQL